MECDVCNLKEKINTKDNTPNLYLCDGCRKPYCKTCAPLTASEVKVLILKERVMKFYCKKCLSMDTLFLLQKTIEDKNEIITTKEEVIALLKNKIEELQRNSVNCEPNTMTYSSALQKTTDNRITTIPSLIIKPKQQQNPELTKNELRQKIKLSELKVGIKNSRPTKNGSLIIRCHSRREMEILKNEAEKNLQNYEIQLTKLRNPRFKIVGCEGNLNEEELETCIRAQNQFIADSDEMKITFVKEIKSKHTHTIYGECSPELFSKFMAVKKIFVGWESCPIYEDISILRCYKCQGYYHKSDNCPQKIEKCEYCAGNHSVKDNCPKNMKKCINCVDANNKYNLNHEVTHLASDPICPSYQYLLGVLRSRINYGNGF